VHSLIIVIHELSLNKRSAQCVRSTESWK